MKLKFCAVCLSAGFVLGLITGGLGVSTLVSYKLDQYHHKIDVLETILKDKSIRLEKLEESINTKKFVLKKVEIFLLTNEESIDNTEIEKVIKEKYKNLLGKEIKFIDIELVNDVMDNRIIIVNGKQYKLKVLKILLSDTLKIWIQAK